MSGAVDGGRRFGRHQRTMRELLEWADNDREAMAGMGLPILTDAGWFYTDLPGMFTADEWAVITAIIGEGQFQYLTKTIINDRPVRGQLYVSPGGLANLRQYAGGPPMTRCPECNSEAVVEERRG